MHMHSLVVSTMETHAKNYSRSEWSTLSIQERIKAMNETLDKVEGTTTPAITTAMSIHSIETLSHSTHNQREEDTAVEQVPKRSSVVDAWRKRGGSISPPKNRTLTVQHSDQAGKNQSAPTNNSTPVVAAEKQRDPAQQQAYVKDLFRDNNIASSSRTLLVLYSNQSLNRDVVSKQQRVFTVLDSKNIIYETLDGVDRANNEKRTTLFQLSGMHAKYPQFFLVGDGRVTFWGDYDDFESANDNGTLVEDLPLHHDDKLHKSPTNKTLPSILRNNNNEPADLTIVPSSEETEDKKQVVDLWATRTTQKEIEEPSGVAKAAAIQAQAFDTPTTSKRSVVDIWKKRTSPKIQGEDDDPSSSTNEDDDNNKKGSKSKDRWSKLVEHTDDVPDMVRPPPRLPVLQVKEESSTTGNVLKRWKRAQEDRNSATHSSIESENERDPIKMESAHIARNAIINSSQLTPETGKATRPSPLVIPSNSSSMKRNRMAERWNKHIAEKAAENDDPAVSANNFPNGGARETKEDEPRSPYTDSPQTPLMDSDIIPSPKPSQIAQRWNKMIKESGVVAVAPESTSTKPTKTQHRGGMASKAFTPHSPKANDTVAERWNNQGKQSTDVQTKSSSNVADRWVQRVITNSAKTVEQTPTANAVNNHDADASSEIKAASEMLMKREQWDTGHFDDSQVTVSALQRVPTTDTDKSEIHRPSRIVPSWNQLSSTPSMNQHDLDLPKPTAKTTGGMKTGERTGESAVVRSSHASAFDSYSKSTTEPVRREFNDSLNNIDITVKRRDFVRIGQKHASKALSARESFDKLETKQNSHEAPKRHLQDGCLNSGKNSESKGIGETEVPEMALPKSQSVSMLRTERMKMVQAQRRKHTDSDQIVTKQEEITKKSPKTTYAKQMIEKSDPPAHTASKFQYNDLEDFSNGVDEFGFPRKPMPLSIKSAPVQKSFFTDVIDSHRSNVSETASDIFSGISRTSSGGSNLSHRAKKALRLRRIKRQATEKVNQNDERRAKDLAQSVLYGGDVPPERQKVSNKSTSQAMDSLDEKRNKAGLSPRYNTCTRFIDQKVQDESSYRAKKKTGAAITPRQNDLSLQNTFSTEETSEYRSLATATSETESVLHADSESPLGNNVAAERFLQESASSFNAFESACGSVTIGDLASDWVGEFSLGAQQLAQGLQKLATGHVAGFQSVSSGEVINANRKSKSKHHDEVPFDEEDTAIEVEFMDDDDDDEDDPADDLGSCALIDDALYAKDGKEAFSGFNFSQPCGEVPPAGQPSFEEPPPMRRKS